MKRTKKNILLGVLLGFLTLLAMCAGLVMFVASFLVGLALRAFSRAYDSAVITLTVYYVLKTIKAF